MGGRGAAGSWWVETRDAAHHPTRHSPRHKEAPTPNANSAVTPSHPHSHLWGGQGLCGPAMCPSGEAGLSPLRLNPLPVLQVAHRQAQPSSEGLVLPPPASQETLWGLISPQLPPAIPGSSASFYLPGPSSQPLPASPFPKWNSRAPQAQPSPARPSASYSGLFSLPKNGNPTSTRGQNGTSHRTSIQSNLLNK